MGIKIKETRYNREAIEAEEFRRNAPEILDTREAALFLGVSTATVLKLTETSGLPCKKLGERTFIYGKRSIIDWVNS